MGDYVRCGHVRTCSSAENSADFQRRGVYVVQGVRYDFEAELVKSGLDVEHQSLEVESLKETFAFNVAVDVRRQLAESDAGHMGQRCSNQLVQAATALLTQSGLANIERACGDHIIVSGGDQELFFELKQGPPRCWDLVLSCKKSNFTSFMLGSRSDEAEVLICAPSSHITRQGVSLPIESDCRSRMGKTAAGLP